MLRPFEVARELQLFCDSATTQALQSWIVSAAAVDGGSTMYAHTDRIVQRKRTAFESVDAITLSEFDYKMRGVNVLTATVQTINTPFMGGG
jgi:hypothetical protein